MPKEIPPPRPTEDEPERRWFSSATLDLIVWLRGGSVVEFQLCYDRAKGEKIVLWREGDMLRHAAIRDGEERAGRPKGSPILVADGPLDRASLRARVHAEGEMLPEEIRTAVLAALRDDD